MMQHEYIQTLISHVEADRRIKAAWLEGSFGRGNADRYSDLDIHLLLEESDTHDFKGGIEGWLSTIQPLVLFSLLFNDTMVNALTQDGLRLDVWLHSGPSIAIDPTKTQVLYQTGDAITHAHAVKPHDPVAITNTLLRQTKEFWRCIALTPSVIGRNELIVAFSGLAIETQVLTDVLIVGYGITRDSGIKRLNEFLPEHTQQLIEDVFAMQEISQRNLVKAHMKLARVMQEHGRIIAAKHGYTYPAELETVVLDYVYKELVLLDLDITTDISKIWVH